MQKLALEKRLTFDELYEKNKDLSHINSVLPIPAELEDDLGAATDWIRQHSGLPTFLLDLKIPHEEMHKEALANEEQFVNHRGGTSPGWSSMAVHGTAVHHTQPREYYFKNKKKMPEYKWTDLAKKCPVTVDWLKSLGFKKFSRVRFMKLDVNGYITPHADTNERGIQAWNVALNNPEGHKFVMDGYGLVPWEAGQVRGIDIGIKHTVKNYGLEPRIHMIIHGGFDIPFLETMYRSYKKLYEEFKNDNR